VLHEYALVRGPAGDPVADHELEALKAAILVEDVYGVTLDDAEIARDVLGTPDAVRALVERCRERT